MVDVDAQASDGGTFDGGPTSMDAGPDMDTGPRPDSGRPDSGPRDAAPLPDVPTDALPFYDPEPAYTALGHALCDTRAHAFCEAGPGCGCVSTGSVGDPASCRVEIYTQCSFEIRSAFSSLSFDRPVVDDAAADECAMLIDALSDRCEAPGSTGISGLPPVCTRILTSDLPIARACTYFGRCAGGAGLCEGPGSSCAALPAEGEPCTGYCAGTAICADGTCAAEPRAEGESCRRSTDCEGSLRCLGGLCTNGGATGASCTSTETCAVGHTCTSSMCASATGATCNSDGQCGARARCFTRVEQLCVERLPVGATCNSPEQCETVNCVFSDRGVGTCAPIPRLGEPCSGPCEGSLRCDREVGTCQPRRPAGSPCSFDSEACMEGLACVRGLCSTAPRLGELCSDDSRCDTGLVCIFDGSTGMQSCQPPPRVGERCDSGICEASAFCDWGTMLCAARLDVGGDCQFDNSRCIEGLVCLGDDRGSITRCAPLPRLGERCTSGVCFEAACVEAPAVGQCEPTLCTQLGGGDVEPPRPEPF